VIIGLVGLLAIVVVAAAIRSATGGHPLTVLRVRAGRGLPVRELARRLDLSPEELAALKVHYDERFIPKRSGGQRRLLVPSPELKAIQRRILHRLLRRLRAHPAATGFEPGRSIVHNASPHVGQAVVVGLDVIDFFPATSATRVLAYFQRIGWDAEAATLLTRLTTWDDGLPQGAPTSPRLSNLLNFGLDSRIQRFVEFRKGAYTRYADDITISFPKDYSSRVRGTIQMVRSALKSRGYTLHGDKVRIMRRHQRQTVTGLVVNDGVNLPRRLRRRLRAVEHHLKSSRPATLSAGQLTGWHALMAMIRQQSRVDP